MNSTADPPVLPSIAREVVTHLDATASLVLDAEAVQVRNEEEVALADVFLSMIQGDRQRAESARVTLVRPLNDHVKMINAKFKAPDAIYKRASEIVRGKVLSYQADVERRRQAEIRRLEAEEAERVRVAAQEQARKDAEARALAAQAETEARRAEEAAGEDARALAAAAAVREFAVAAAALEQHRAAKPAPMTLAIRVPEPQRALGSAATRTRWVGTVTDPARVPREYLVVDQRLVNEAVRRGARSIPGVHIEEVASLAVRGR